MIRDRVFWFAEGILLAANMVIVLVVVAGICAVWRYRAILVAVALGIALGAATPFLVEWWDSLADERPDEERIFRDQARHQARWMREQGLMP